jgi:putative ATP-dependent endonuclease of OLD family
MALVRALEIDNFRAIKRMRWLPGHGVNCLVGAGDTGKSTILDAIDLCIGARRSPVFTDADFHALDFDHPIRIAVTLGDLEDQFLNMEAYGDYHVGFHAAEGVILPEPDLHLETALTLQLTVDRDLEPQWSLVSPRAQAVGKTRNLNWTDRVRLAPTRLGATSDLHLGWRRGSVLNRISGEKADATTALAEAIRTAREAFAAKGLEGLEDALQVVTTTAQSLGVPVGDSVKALIDAGSVSISGGGVALHDDRGIPLRALGVGSTRLLIAGLQRKAADEAPIVLIDEVEFGLEPHRIIRLLSALGAKEKSPPLQVFMTTHSPTVVVELSAEQLHVVRLTDNEHIALRAAEAGDVQGTIRVHPQAILARSVLVCEGATETGLIRGLDQWRTESAKQSISALGASLVDAGGVSKVVEKAQAFLSLGYRTALLRDSDVDPAPGTEEAFTKGGGRAFAWNGAVTLEQVLFENLAKSDAFKLLRFAKEHSSTEVITSQIAQFSGNKITLKQIIEEAKIADLSPDSRAALGMAANKGKWFKTVSLMEEAARTIVGPGLANANKDLTTLIDACFEWMGDGT